MARLLIFLIPLGIAIWVLLFMALAPLVRRGETEAPSIAPLSTPRNASAVLVFSR